jgi:nitrite reductase (NADH) small subunit
MSDPLVTRPPEWHRAAARAEVQTKGSLRVKLAGRPIALLWWNDRVHAIDDRCPHRGSSLAAGIIEPDGYISCLDHGWEYSLENGCGRQGYEGCAEVFRVDDRDGDIWILVTFRPMPVWAQSWDDDE